MKYGFIGCGNMGGAIARAVSQSTKDILITDKTGAGRDLARQLGIAYGDMRTVARECPRIFLAVKPHIVPEVLESIRPLLSERTPLLISMAAGVEIQRIEALAGCSLPVIRIMPNTPVSIGHGMTQYCCNSLVSPEVLQDFLRDMAPSGHLDSIEERLMDAASALSGCGPAYSYLFLEALSDGAVACGLPRKKATEYAAATLEGAARMVLETKLHPGALKDAVCSPGGSTIEGVRTLEERGFRGAVMDCVIAAFQKNQKLGK